MIQNFDFNLALNIASEKPGCLNARVIIYEMRRIKTNEIKDKKQSYILRVCLF